MLPKHLLYLSNDQLCAYQWRRGRLSAGRSFCADRAGMDAFARYLDESPEAPAYIVADLVEEDFQRQLLPHVPGRAGRKLLERRLRQMYRDTPFRHACIQGREPDGRRDDQVMLSALTNPSAVQAWVTLLEQRRAPLAAVYSAAFLSALLVGALAIEQEHLLLITRQSGGLRQSYFQGRELKFSRLTALDSEHGADAALLPTPGPEALAAAVMTETGKMQQFLTSTQLLRRGRLLRVVVLAPAACMAALEARCADGPETAFHFIDLEGTAQRLGLEGAPQLADPLLLALVGKQVPPSHCQLGADRRFYHLWQARRALYAASAGVAVASLLWVMADTWNMLEDRRTGARLLAEAAQFDTNYRAIMATLPPTAARPANMKAAVLVAQMLDQQAPAPAAMLAQVSQALERAPAVRLTALDWQVERQPPPGAATGQALAVSNGEATAPIAGASVGVPAAPAQVLRIDGEIEAAQGDYRAILASMNQFAQELTRTPGLAVQVLAAPVELRQNVRLTGKTGLDDIAGKPKFTLRVTWKP